MRKRCKIHEKKLEIKDLLSKIIYKSVADRVVCPKIISLT